jgi:glycosyltransferase involved in cell wall biosynthesis
MHSEMPRNPLTALVTSFNEVDQIEECISSLLWADQIVLIDSFSTDGTVELVRERFPSVLIEQRAYLGAAAQKNWAIDRLENDWVLVVDADERVTPQLREEIVATLVDPRFPAYSIGRRNFVLGKEVRFSGLQRDRVTRLFDRKNARYPNRRVHADLVVNGRTGFLRQKFLHNYVRSFDHMSSKMNRYALWSATQMFVDGKRSSGFSIIGHAGFRMLRDYIFNLGFLDGTRGLITTGMHTYYVFWKYVKLWEFSVLERRGRHVPLVDLDLEGERWTMPWEEKKESL